MRVKQYIIVVVVIIARSPVHPLSAYFPRGHTGNVRVKCLRATFEGELVQRKMSVPVSLVAIANVLSDAYQNHDAI